MNEVQELFKRVGREDKQGKVENVILITFYSDEDESTGYDITSGGSLTRAIAALEALKLDLVNQYNEQ